MPGEILKITDELKAQIAQNPQVGRDLMVALQRGEKVGEGIMTPAVIESLTPEATKYGNDEFGDQS